MGTVMNSYEALGVVEDTRASIGSESSSTGQVFKKKEEYEPIPHR